MYCQNMIIEKNYKPLVSIIIPTNQIEDCFKNIMKWCDYPELDNFEIIIVHDTKIKIPCSEKEEHKIATLAFLRIISSDCGSPGAARNLGLSVARGEWIAFWDSDDYPRIQEFTRLLKETQKSGNKIGVGSYVVKDIKGRILDKRIVSQKRTRHRNVELFINPGIWSWVFSSDVLKGHKFSEFKRGEDQIFLGLINAFDFVLTKSREVVYEYYVGHASQLTRNQEFDADLLEASRLMSNMWQKASFWTRKFLRISSTYMLLSYSKRRVRNLTFIFTYLKLQKSESFLTGFFVIIFLKIVKQKLNFTFRMRKLVLYQAGGLGNQLFQLAFTQSLPAFEKVIIVDQIECDFIRELTNELINSHNCRALEIVHRKSIWIERKMRNILLRKSNGESYRQFSWQNLLNWTVRIVNQVMVNRISLHVPETVGFDKKLSFIQPSRTAVLVGYFQSYEWAQSAKAAYSRVLERSVSDSIRNSKLARDLAAEESICVQVRLGDITLKKNESIGSLNLEYFQASLEKLAGNRSDIQLYVFTNDSASLMPFLKNYNNLSPQLIPNEYSCVDNLWLMSQSHKLIISNSTFAWWGGFGSSSTNNTVVAPTPWFAKLKSPEKLIPSSWIQVSRG